MGDSIKKAEEIKVNGATEVKKTQKPSATYTIKQIGEIARKLLELELIERNEAEALINLQQNVFKTWCKKEMKL